MRGWVRRGAMGLHKRLHRMRAARGRHGAVLMYHRVAKPRTDPWDLAVTPGNFADHVDILRRRGDCLSLNGLRANLDAGASRHAFVVTFDDGYRDNFDAALPVLRNAGVPATVFITTGTIGSGREFWWDVLVRAFLETPDLPDRIRLNNDAAAREWHLGPDPGEARRRAVLDAIRTYLLEQGPETIERSIEDIAGQIGIERAGPAANHPMEHDELRSMAASGQIEIGGHTRTHAALTMVPRAAATEEIRRGRANLRDWTGQDVDSFAAPYGKQDEWVAGAVREAGFARACTVMAGLCYQKTDPFWIPRIQVPDLTGEEFEKLIWDYVGD